MLIWLHCNAFYFLTATPPVIDYRLPALLKPNHYTLKLRPDIYTGDPSTFTFNGSVDIDVTCTQDTDKVILHSRSLNIQSFKVLEDAVSGSELALGEHKYDSITEFLTVPLSGATLKKGNHYIIKITFDGKILPDLRGIYYSSYEYGDETRYNAFSLFRCHWSSRDANFVATGGTGGCLITTFDATSDDELDIMTILSIQCPMKFAGLKTCYMHGLFSFVLVSNENWKLTSWQLTISVFQYAHSVSYKLRRVWVTTSYPLCECKLLILALTLIWIKLISACKRGIWLLLRLLKRYHILWSSHRNPVKNLHIPISQCVAMAWEHGMVHR